MKSAFTFSDKRRLILELGLTLDDLKQIVAEMEEEAAESQADNMTISDYVFIQKKLEVVA